MELACTRRVPAARPVLAGKTVTVRRGGDGTISCELNGDDSPRLARQLRFWLDRDEDKVQK